MSDLIAIVSIISSATVILISIYFNWKKLKLEAKMMLTEISLKLYPELKDKAIAMGIKYNDKMPSGISKKLLDELQDATFKFQDKWIKKNIKNRKNK